MSDQRVTPAQGSLEQARRRERRRAAARPSYASRCHAISARRQDDSVRRREVAKGIAPAGIVSVLGAELSSKLMRFPCACTTQHGTRSDNELSAMIRIAPEMLAPLRHHLSGFSVAGLSSVRQLKMATTHTATSVLGPVTAANEDQWPDVSPKASVHPRSRW
jgi:hypothetical protein